MEHTKLIKRIIQVHHTIEALHNQINQTLVELKTLGPSPIPILEEVSKFVDKPQLAQHIKGKVPCIAKGTCTKPLTRGIIPRWDLKTLPLFQAMSTDGTGE